MITDSYPILPLALVVDTKTIANKHLTLMKQQIFITTEEQQMQKDFLFEEKSPRIEFDFS